MKNLRKYLDQMKPNVKPEERIICQVMDLKMIQYNGVERQVFMPGDFIYKAIDDCIHGFMWLYEKGYTLEKNLMESLQSEGEKFRYNELQKAFSEVNKFMANNMSLKE